MDYTEKNKKVKELLESQGLLYAVLSERPSKESQWYLLIYYSFFTDEITLNKEIL